MSDTTAIEWATHTFNPWEGCTKISPGCANCYAEARNKRFSGGANWGKGKPRRRTSAANWRNPIIWNRQGGVGNIPFDGTRPRVFPSLCDWLDDDVPIEWLADFLKLIHDTPNLDWLLLTKRPENFVRRMDAVSSYGETIGQPDTRLEEDGAWFASKWHNTPPANVWLGTSVEDQTRADARIPALLKIPATVRFLSVEPLLGPVNLPSHLGRVDAPGCISHGDLSDWIDWVILGGESGPVARPCNVEWIRDLARQCQAAGVPCFVKQLGSLAIGKQSDQRFPFNHGATLLDKSSGTSKLILEHPKGGDPAEWPEDLRVREFPNTVTTQ
jgi:protein gp37